MWAGGPVCGVDSGTEAWGPVLPGDVSGVSGVFGYSAGEGGVVCSVRCLCGLLPGSRCVGFAYDPWVTSTTCKPATAWPSPSDRQTAQQTVHTTDLAQHSILRRYAIDEVSLADLAKAYNDGRSTIHHDLAQLKPTSRCIALPRLARLAPGPWADHHPAVSSAAGQRVGPGGYITVDHSCLPGVRCAATRSFTLLCNVHVRLGMLLSSTT